MLDGHSRYVTRYSGPFGKVCEVYDRLYGQVVVTFYCHAAHDIAERMTTRMNHK